MIRAALFSLLIAGAAHAQDTSLTASLKLTDPMSGTDVVPSDGEAVRLTVTLQDAASGLPPRGMDLFAWARPVEAGMASCARAAQAFRATRSIPLGAHDLNGILVLTLNRDASVGVIDPKLDLRSSNMLAAHQFEIQPVDIAIDRVGMRAIVTFPEDGRIAAMSLIGGDVRDVATGYPAPTTIGTASNGQVWIASGTDGTVRRIGSDGDGADRIALGTGHVTLRQLPDPEIDRIGAFTRGGALVLFDGTTGRIVLRTQADVPIADATFLGDDMALALIDGQPEARLFFADAPDDPVIVPTGLPFTRITSGPDARIALAYTPGTSTFAVIDTALGQVVQSATLNDATLSEVSFTDNAAFLLSHDGGFVGAIDLATVALGNAALIRNVTLGSASDSPPAGAQLLSPLFPSPQVLAVEPANQTGWVIGEIASSVEMPPMHSVRLRGGIPHVVRVVDRSFTETAPGRFETVWAFPAGPHELVLTTGIGGLSTCIPFQVGGDHQRAALTPLTLRAVPENGPLQAGQIGQIAIELTDAHGVQLRVDTLPLRLPAMQSSWSGRAIAKAGADGVLRTEVRFPHAGTFVVQPDVLPPGTALRAAETIQVEE